jgi:hypothetical protein
MFKNYITKEEFKNMIDYIRMANTEINRLFQIQSQEDTTRKNDISAIVAIVAILFGGMAYLLYRECMFSDNLIKKILSGYMAIVLICFFIIFCLCSIIKCKSNWQKQVVKSIFIIVTLVCSFIILIYVVIKKLFNWEIKDFYKDFIVQLLILSFSLASPIICNEPNKFILTGSIFILEFMEKIFNITFRIESIEVLVLIGLFWIEMRISNNIVLRIIKMNIKDEVLEPYRKNLWKFQLLFLIGGFVIVTFIPDVFFINQSDVINAITIITLIILYKDKL